VLLGVGILILRRAQGRGCRRNLEESYYYAARTGQLKVLRLVRGTAEGDVWDTNVVFSFAA
jgi:hypothetical protein